MIRSSKIFTDQICLTKKALYTSIYRSMMSKARNAQPITLITGNKNKLKEFIAILGESFQEKIINNDVDLPEYQGDPDEVARAKSELAAKEIKGPLITEDTCLCFNALGGMPGPYIKWFLQKIGPEGLHKMLHGFEDKSAYALCTLAYHPGGEGSKVLLFRGRTDGKIIEPRGSREFGWDPCFQPDGYTETFAEMSKDVKNKISHRYKAVNALGEYFMNQKK